MRCFLLLAFVLSSGESSPLVKISDGLVQGTLSTSYAGNAFAEFIGIPYGKAPRFEEPLAAEAWEGTWIANRTTSCVQLIHYPNPEAAVATGDEDCLHLSVYVPGNEIDAEANRDVLVHFHGGAFMFGNGDMYAGPKYLMDNDVVFVTLNYRLGVFGFLSTGDERLPGNLGMKDQVLALKWIKNNIRHFGGNPESVTITGLSAGGSSVHFHLMSPMSRGLFAKAISVSGSSLNAWTMQENPLDKARRIGAAVGCTQKCTKELVKCLKSRNAGQLNEATKLLRSYKFNPFSPVALVVDSSSDNPFLPQHPYELLTQGDLYDVPYLMTATAAEGLYPAADFPMCASCLQKLNEDWNEVAPAILHYSEAVPKDKMDEVSQSIRKFYLGNEDISRDSFSKLVQMIGDRLFVADLELTARLHSNAVASPVYFYHFNYTAEEVPSISRFFTGTNERFGVSHGDDMLLVLSDVHVDELPKLAAGDEEMMRTLVGIWTSFARSGKPNIPSWKPVSKKIDDPFDYLHIQHGLEMRQAEELGFRSFWESLPFEENANLFKTKPMKTEL